jgi:hypothetical protein
VKSVTLTRKLADVIDGIDLEGTEVGDRIELSRRDADILIAEGWAEPSTAARPGRSRAHREIAADRPRRPRKKPKN